ncbi:MAG: lasso peptide biosynthesis PqqD family chaperone [Roseivirga sp.]|nr:lasso peptide biosynthesis PqqD family chaperone [Roseivirga sp.]
MTIVRNGGLLDSEIDGETVMMSVEQGNYYGLNQVGTEIWKLIESPIKVEDICKALVKEYKVEQDTCEKEVLSFLNDLTSEKIVVLS